jgi:hypothetical protein
MFEYESGGILRQSIMMVTVNTRFNRNVSIYANYQLTHANDLPSTPTNPYDFMQDYGRSTLDRRNNFQSDTPRRAGGLMSWAASKAVGPWV